MGSLNVALTRVGDVATAAFPGGSVATRVACAQAIAVPDTISSTIATATTPNRRSNLTPRA
jgi:hypothetical protein